VVEGGILMKVSRGDKILNLIICFILVIIGFTMLYPFWNAAVISLNVGADTARGGITFWPRQFTLENYKIMFADGRIPRSFLITVAKTAIGTFLSIMFTAMFGYALSKKELVGRKIYMILAVITMYFSGGLIPYYLLIRDLGLMNKFAVLVVPGIISVWHMLIFKSFFSNIPAGLEESARIDGCNYIATFYRIVLPVSGPVIASLSLFSAVGHWNEWFMPGILISKPDKLPIQALLNQIINSNIMDDATARAGASVGAEITKTITTQSLVMATMMIATIPIILVYPFVQKYFVQGVMIGSLKE
jgi:putative aldouronate transport system permease protein